MLYYKIIMKKLFYFLFFSLCLISCSEDDSNEVVAKYKFNVDASSTRAYVTNYTPLEFVCEPGDKIEILVRVFDKALNDSNEGIYDGLDDLIKNVYERELIYDGTNWNIDNGGKSSHELVVKGKEGDVVEIRYGMNNYPKDRTEDCFSKVCVKKMELTSGSQTVVLDFEVIIPIVYNR